MLAGGAAADHLKAGLADLSSETLAGFRAPVSIAGAMSTPTTMPDEPMACSATRAASPVPVETSRIRSPGTTLAAAITIGTNIRDQRSVQRS